MAMPAYKSTKITMSLDDFAKFCEREENRGKRMELIDGVLVEKESMMAGGARLNHHWVSGEIFRQIGNYLVGKTCRAYMDANVYLPDAADDTTGKIFQPDVMVGCDPQKRKQNGYQGAPDFVAEVISPSTAWYDCAIKQNYYLDNGVRELWMVNYLADRITVYHNQTDSIQMTNYTFADTVPVRIFDGLSIDFREIAQRLDHEF